MKEFIVYQKGETRVYIHKGTKKVWRNNKWVTNKLYWYGIRRDDNTGLAHWLGLISFNPRWRQYTTKFEPNTEWSAGCKCFISAFENQLNKEWRKSLKRIKK